MHDNTTNTQNPNGDNMLSTHTKTTELPHTKIEEKRDHFTDNDKETWDQQIFFTESNNKDDTDYHNSTNTIFSTSSQQITPTNLKGESLISTTKEKVSKTTKTIGKCIFKGMGKFPLIKCILATSLVFGLNSNPSNLGDQTKQVNDKHNKQNPPHNPQHN